LNLPITVFVKEVLQSDDPALLRKDQTSTIPQGKFFRVPLPWIISQTKLSLYIKIGNRS